MAFNSITYLVFLAVTLVLYFNLRHAGRLALLIFASLVFYAFWSVPLTGLIVLSALIDFSAGLGIARAEGRPGRRRLWLALSLIANLGLLGYFKYTNFFLDNLRAVWGDAAGWSAIEVVLPPGISFYTFQTMSYTIDVYRGKIGATRSFLRFFLYVSFFPQLVAGPIERAAHLLTQFDYVATQRFSLDNFAVGLRMIVWGLFKKVMIADQVGGIADAVYADPAAYDGWSALIATYAFTLQIYCDFSAYSEIAKGSARMFGVDLMDNFNQPYISTNVAEFWRRWHISLSTWIRDYIFIPLGGSRGGSVRTLVNLTITMFLSGLWHGASWNFVLWGLFHGVLLVLHILARRAFEATGALRGAGPVWRFGSWFLTFHLVVLGWVLFRARSLDAVWIALERMGSIFTAGALPTLAQAGFLAFVAIFVALTAADRRWRIRERIDGSTALSTIGYGVAILVLALYARGGGPQFIYFQF